MKDSTPTSAGQPAKDKVDPVALGHAIDAVDMTDLGLGFINANIYPVMSAISELSNFDSTDANANRNRMLLIKDLAKLGRVLTEEAASRIETEQRDMQAKLHLLQGGAA